MKWILCYFLLFCASFVHARAKVELGIDRFFKEEHHTLLKGKRVGLVTNQTGVDQELNTTVDLFKEHAEEFTLVALFSPEHGLSGTAYAGEKVFDVATPLPIYSLYGKTRRPTDKMLQGIDVLVFDIQEIGSRSYTYATTLFYLMEEAAKRQIMLIVLDRPNPINGIIVDGPALREEWRSFLGYIDVCYCHGMTIGELAYLFNEEYKVGCDLTVITMKGWERWMSFKDTGLQWIPTSPNIPEEDTPFFYASTGILGELSLVNIGIGFTQPFKLVGAPWIHAATFAERLNAQKLPGVKFFPFSFRPMYGLYKDQDCQGVKILITNQRLYRPLAVQYLLLGVLKTLYPKHTEEKLRSLSSDKKEMFCRLNGNKEMLDILLNEKYVAWKMIQMQEKERKAFLKKRQKYLLY